MACSIDFEELARIPVEVEYASELRYRNPIINKDDVVIALSQSGETADTMAALELAKDKGNWSSKYKSIYRSGNSTYLDGHLYGLQKRDYSKIILQSVVRRFGKNSCKSTRSFRV